MYIFGKLRCVFDLKRVKMSYFEEIERDFDIINDSRLLRMPKLYRERFDPFDLNEQDFYSRYRLDKATVHFLIEILDIEEPSSNRGLPVAPSTQVLCTLRFLGRNVHQSDIGDLHGLSQATVGRIIKNICRRIALLLPHFIRFPSCNELNEVKNKFFQIARFPTVIGAIDCTHVRIKCPAKSVGPMRAGHFLNRKGYYSLNVQIVCDADFKIMDIVARSRGSRHDARIWDNCQLKRKLEQTKHQHNGVLVGDSGYPNSSILLTPIRNPISSNEQRYNRSHISTRTKIECLNGQLKSKFRSIFERLRVDLETAKNVIIAVAVLHNIAKERNLSFVDMDSAVRETHDTESIEILEPNTSNSGRAYRTAFINRYF